VSGDAAAGQAMTATRRPIRPAREQAMTKAAKAETSAIMASIARPATRSSLFWWLLDNHAAILESASGRKLDWRRLCTNFRDQGLTDLEGKPPTLRTARMTWWRVRKEHARIETQRAERERLAAANPHRNMPSQFRKGDYRPPLAAAGAPRLTAPATTGEQTRRGFKLSTAEGVVVTRAGRVGKTEQAAKDYVFEEDGTIRQTDFRSSFLRVKQTLNVRGGRPINDSTESLYADIGLVLIKEEKR
jgi:hypothetical protein